MNLKPLYVAAAVMVGVSIPSSTHAQTQQVESKPSLYEQVKGFMDETKSIKEKYRRDHYIYHGATYNRRYRLKKDGKDSLDSGFLVEQYYLNGQQSLDSKDGVSTGLSPTLINMA